MRRASLSLALLVCSAAAARAQESPLYPPDAKVEGKTLAEWAAGYLQWSLAIKKDRSPVTDRTGEFAGEGQAGPVWYLGGTMGDVPERKVKVPSGKPIFSPLVFILTVDLNGPLGEPDMLRLKRSANRHTGLSVELDGKDLGKVDGHRAAVPPTKVAIPQKVEEVIFPPFAGKTSVIADGHWFLLKPLPAGEHVLRIRGQSPGEKLGSPGFKLDLTYRLTVEKR